MQPVTSQIDEHRISCYGHGTSDKLKRKILLMTTLSY